MLDFLSIINFSALVSRLLLFLANAVGLELVLWAYIANFYTRPGRVFLLGAFYFLLWMDLDFLSAQAPLLLAPDAARAVSLVAFRGMSAVLAIFFCAFYIFAANFPVRNVLDKSRRGRENLQIATWSFLFVASFTPLVVKDTVFDPALPYAIWIATGPLFWVYAAVAALTLAISFSELSRNRIFADAQNRRKAILAALAAGTFGIFNLLFNVIGPAIGSLSYLGFFAQFGDYAVALLMGYAAYQFVRDKLFGVKVILVEIFVGLMGASLVVMPFFVGFLWQQAILVVLFCLFCVFGYLLIRSTVKEYREKEVLEQRVAERTKELEDIKQNLEEVNSVLEVRVRARTRELEKLNRTLEEKVVARTNDLEAKIKDLETFQRITVGRELKMIDLKQENERLRRSLSASGIAAEQK